MIEVDSSKCTRCSACVRDCFFGALGLGADGLPEMKNESRCMRCQHCLAVCPQAAIAFDGKKSEDSLALSGLELPSWTAAENFIRARRSTRQYRQQDVERDKLERILKALGNSPTGCNARALKFTCFATRKAMESFKADFIRAIEEHRDGDKLLPRWLAAPAIQLRNGKGDVFFRNAAGMLIVSCDERRPGVTTPHEDVVIACSQFELLAQSLGLGTCWCGFLSLVQREVPELLEKTLGIRRTTPFYAMLFGIPAVRYQRTVQRDDEAEIEWKE